LVRRSNNIVAVNMWQSEVTEFFHSRKRNTNFQPSKRQKIDVERSILDVPSTKTPQVCRNDAVATKTDTTSVGQTKASAKIPDSKKRNTRSRIPKLQKESGNIQLTDIWPKSLSSLSSADQNTDDDRQPSAKSKSCTLTPRKQHLNVTAIRKSRLPVDNEESSGPTVDRANTVNDESIPISPSKRRLQHDATEKCGTHMASDVATEVIDDHGNCHAGTPSKLRVIKPDIASTTLYSKRGRCMVPTNSSNYYKTPQKFDFSPYQSILSSQRSSSARKKLVMSQVNMTKSPSLFVFKGSTEKSPESAAIVKTKENSLAESQKETKDAPESSDKVVENDECSSRAAEDTEAADKTLSADIGNKMAETPRKTASSVVKIGACRNLDELKKKLWHLSPQKPSTTPGGSSTCKRWL